MKEKIFKEKVEDYAVLRVEQGEHQRRMGKIANIAKLALGMKSQEFKSLADAIYSTTPVARDKASKGGKNPKTKLDRVIEQFADMYSALALLGHAEKVERLLNNRGIKVGEAYEGALIGKYKTDVFGKKLEKLNAMWDEEFRGVDMPRTAPERAKALIDSAVTTKNDIEVIREKFTGEEFEDAANDAEVKKPHLARAVSIRVVAIKSGDDKADEKATEVAEDANRLAEVMEVLKGGGSDEEESS